MKTYEEPDEGRHPEAEGGRFCRMTGPGSPTIFYFRVCLFPDEEAKGPCESDAVGDPGLETLLDKPAIKKTWRSREEI